VRFREGVTSLKFRLRAPIRNQEVNKQKCGLRGPRSKEQQKSFDLALPSDEPIDAESDRNDRKSYTRDRARGAINALILTLSITALTLTILSQYRRAEDN
jgi:hypothetical protein